MSKPTPANYYNQLMAQLQKKKKQFKRRKFLFQTKVFFTVILPVFIIVLAVKTAQTWIRLKLRSIASATLLSEND